MLSQDAIDNLVEPIITRQEAINDYVVKVIAARVREIGTMKSSDIYKLQRILKSGADVRKINRELARLTGLQEVEIKKLIRTVAEDAYIDVKPYYDYRSVSYVPFVKNIELQRAVQAMEKQTIGEYRNLSRTGAFMIRDLRRPKLLRLTPIAKTYQTVVDEAIQASRSGVIDYNTAMRRTMKQLNESGIRTVTYESETGKKRTEGVGSALRRTILGGLRQLNQMIQDITGSQFGADGKELTVHMNPAPDHEDIQGHQFKNSEYDKLQSNQPFQDVKHRKYDAIRRAIGTWNCRHFAYSIIIGFAKPNYSQKELDEIIKKNHEGYTDKNGKHYTGYECTQKQREFERKIRKAKEGQMMAQESGDDVLASEYRSKVVDLTKQYNAFSKACGISARPERASVPGYRK